MALPLVNEQAIETHVRGWVTVLGLMFYEGSLHSLVP